MMAGCYGNSAEDRYYEKQLDDYLDDLSEPWICDRCGEIIGELDDYEEVDNEILCGNCAALS